MNDEQRTDAFIESASVPIGAAHDSGTVDDAEALRAADPAVTRRSIHAAAVAGDAVAVREWLRRDPTLATRPGGPRGWPPLTYLCFSRYLRHDASGRTPFVDAAEALLRAGADPSGGFFDATYAAQPVWESVLYGAAGLAQHEALTRLLLAHGADANDGEVVYHAPESRELATVRALVEHGRLSPRSLAILLARKHDWHDEEGVRYLLAHGADPDLLTDWGVTALHQAVRRDNPAPMVAACLQAGATPTLPMAPPAVPPTETIDAVALAACRGRDDLLDLFASAGYHLPEDSHYRLLAACARGDQATAAALAASAPAPRAFMEAHAAEVLCTFAGNGNTAGVRCLAALGLPVDAVWDAGDGYFGVARRSTALHVAAWRARHDTVEALLALGSTVEAQDAAGRTPLQLAVLACTNSWWRDRRTPASIVALLAAGADPSRVRVPTGYADADRLLVAHR